MWTESQENGKVKFIERYKDHLTGKSKKVSVTLDKDTTHTRKIARKILDEKIMKKQMLVYKHEVTFQELVEAYRKDQLATVKEQTYRRNYYTCNTFLKMFGSDTIVDNLTAGYIKSVFLATGKDAITLNEYRTRFLALIRWGYTNDYLSDISYTLKFQRFNEVPRKSRLKDKYLEIDEFKALIAGMDVQRWVLVAELQALTGMRIGEAAALSKSDVSYKDRTINIDKTYDIIGKKIDDTPKTTCSIRKIYMQDELYTICKKIDAYMNRQRLMYGYAKTDLFLQHEDGGPINYYSYNKYIKENGKRILGRDNITTHIFRHTHTCILAEQGVPEDTISRRLGHEDSEITKKVYFHVTNKMKKMDDDSIGAVKVF